MFISLIKLRSDLKLSEMTGFTHSDGYRFHKLIWKMFSDNPDKQRDFLYRRETGSYLPAFYAVSKNEPMNIGDYWDIQSKIYNPQLRTGETLYFTCTVNPIRSKRDENGKQHRHDVVMNAKKEMFEVREKSDLNDLIQENVGDWFCGKGESLGFVADIGRLRVDGYRQHRLFKGSKGSPIRFSSVDISGVLTVDEPDVFVQNCLFNGIGPAKGFGCGLMMVKRA